MGERTPNVGSYGYNSPLVLGPHSKFHAFLHGLDVEVL